MTHQLIKNYTAEAAVAANRIVKWGATDGAVLQGAAATDAVCGVTNQPGGAAITERIDVVHSGITEVEFGGTVTRGDPITSDGNGKAVAAAPGAGVNNRIVGWAMVSAVAGDIAPMLIAPGQIQG